MQREAERALVKQEEFLGGVLCWGDHLGPIVMLNDVTRAILADIEKLAYLFRQYGRRTIQKFLESLKSKL